MKFTVQWSHRALDAVTQLWLDNANQRAGITRATAAIDQILQFDPNEKGEARDDDRRIFFVPPLVVIFSVNVDRNLVRVLNTRHLKRRGSG